MNWLHTRSFKVISFVVLFFFTWSSGGLFQAAYAINSATERKSGSAEVKNQTKTERPEEKLQKTLDDIQGILNDTATDTNAKKGKLRSKKLELGTNDVEIKKQFKETEDKIKDLPDEIRQRHKDFVKKYDDNLKELNTNLDEIDRAKTEKEKEHAHKKTKEFIEKVKPPKKHIPLDPNNLPHRTAEPVWIEPRTQPEQFLKDSSQQSVVSSQERQRPILIASNGSLDGLLDKNFKYSASAVIPAGSPLTAFGDRLKPESSSFIKDSGYPIGTFGYDELGLTNGQGNPSPVLLALATPPTSADLAQTIEVQFTPEITAKAEELQHNPVKIYNWVRNNIEFVPTYGSIQGANMCLQTKLCNAIDTASLLIALLRVSGIPAKYVQGTIEVPVEKVKNWTGGFTDSNSALTLIASGRIPVKGLTEGGEVKYVQMEHVWVETYTGYGPYSGRPSRLDPPKIWIPLDSSFKQYTYTEGINLETTVPFDAESFLNQLKSTSTINEAESYVTNVDSNYIQTSLANYQDQLQNYINQNMPNATVGDIIGKKEIIKQELGILPVTLPYKKVVTGAKYSAISDTMRHKVTFTVFDPLLFGTSLSYTASIPELAGKRITLCYAPATTTDQKFIDSYGGIYNVPAYLVYMKPQIKVEGIVKATGSSVGLGNQQTFNMTFSGPNLKTDVVSNNVTAGAYYGIGFNPYRIPKKLIEQRKAKLESVKDTINQNNIYTDDYVGELLYATGIVYFFELDIFEDVIAQSYNIAKIKQVSEVMVAKDLSVSYLFSIPIKAEEGGLIIDVDRNIYSPVSKSGDNSKSREFMVAAGQIGSGMEHGIFEQMYNKTGTSAIKALSVANDQGIPIYTINKDNISSILPNLQISNDVKADIQNTVNAGKIVTVSKTNVTIDKWNGVGYIILDQNTGAAAYMISGGFAGGGADVSVAEIVEKLLKYFTIAITLIAIAELLEVVSIIAIDGIALLAALPFIGQLFVFLIFMVIIVIILYGVWILYDNLIIGQQGHRIYKHLRYLYA